MAKRVQKLGILCVEIVTIYLSKEEPPAADANISI